MKRKNVERKQLERKQLERKQPFSDRVEVIDAVWSRLP